MTDKDQDQRLAAINAALDAAPKSMPIWAIDPDRCGLCSQHSYATGENRATHVAPNGSLRCAGHAQAAWAWEHR